MTRDLIAVMSDVPMADVQVDVDFQVGDVTPGDVRGTHRGVSRN